MIKRIRNYNATVSINNHTRVFSKKDLRVRVVRACYFSTSPPPPPPPHDSISKDLFGINLMDQVALKLKREGMDKYGWGGIAYTHRDYCGHGLIYTDYPHDYITKYNKGNDDIKPLGSWNGELGFGKHVYALQVVHDGYFMGTVLGIWENQTDFVSFWSQQSDFSCSGYDTRSESRIFTGLSGSMITGHNPPGNQRITRARLEGYLKLSNVDRNNERYRKS